MYKIVLRGNQSSNLLTIIEELVYIGNASRCHYHTKEDETIRVLNGTLQVYLDGYQFCAPAGTSFYVPRNIIQSSRNLGSKPVHIELLFSPSNIENYLDQITPVFVKQPVNMTRVAELSRTFGVVNLPDIPWKDLNCAFNNSMLFTSSVHLIFFIVLLHVLASVSTESCASGYSSSPSGTCVNLQIDFNNCGSFVYVCASSYTSCSAGVCSSAPAVQLVGAIAIPGWGGQYSVDDNYVTLTLPMSLTINAIDIWVLCLGSCSADYTNENLPSSSFGGPTVFGYWDDLIIYSGTSQSVYYSVAETAPNRLATFEYDTSHYG
ncbi:unnamed protein product [Rotaria sp. Silwood2]|nr:unnamed protein product [Rotaria sp. Silwood2]CAF3950767.1 unnamed protein product [Rotaria sp. Silwood2]